MRDTFEYFFRSTEKIGSRITVHRNDDTNEEDKRAISHSDILTVNTFTIEMSCRNITWDNFSRDHHGNQTAVYSA